MVHGPESQRRRLAIIEAVHRGIEEILRPPVLTRSLLRQHVISLLRKLREGSSTIPTWTQPFASERIEHAQRRTADSARSLRYRGPGKPYLPGRRWATDHGSDWHLGSARSPGPLLLLALRHGLGHRLGLEGRAALDRFTAGVAPELREKNIAIISIYPGMTMTERFARMMPGMDASRLERPETTAKAVAFLCRDPMPYTGQIVVAREIVDKNNL